MLRGVPSSATASVLKSRLGRCAHPGGPARADPAVLVARPAYGEVELDMASRLTPGAGCRSPRWPARPDGLSVTAGRGRCALHGRVILGLAGVACDLLVRPETPSPRSPGCSASAATSCTRVLQVGGPGLGHRLMTIGWPSDLGLHGGELRARPIFVGSLFSQHLADVAVREFWKLTNFFPKPLLSQHCQQVLVVTAIVTKFAIFNTTKSRRTNAQFHCDISQRITKPLPRHCQLGSETHNYSLKSISANIFSRHSRR